MIHTIFGNWEPDQWRPSSCAQKALRKRIRTRQTAIASDRHAAEPARVLK
jgi:hypothetical protein